MQNRVELTLLMVLAFRFTSGFCAAHHDGLHGAGLVSAEP